MSSDQPMRDFGARLRRHRAAAGLTQIELGARMAAHGLAWHGSTVSKTESGDRPPHLSELHALAAVLDVDVLDLINPLGDREVIHAQRGAAAAAGARLAGLLEQVAQVRAEQEQHRRAADTAQAGRSDRIAHLAGEACAAARLASTPARGTGRGRSR
jgi:transcriptional regulator with XRE-family HTH domain